jgi:molybdopterin synthase catalytic subunit
MFAFLLMTARLSAPVNKEQLSVNSAVPRAVAEIKAQTPRYFLNVGGAVIEVDIKLKNSAVQTEDILAWVRRATGAVTTFYGKFPVERARVSIVQDNEDDQSIHGTTWGDVDGFQGVSRMRLGRAVSRADLETDWTMTHELVHMAIASLADEHHWLEEGLATYVEPIARAQDGQLPAAKVWESMVSGMAEGEPQRGDHGLDKTHTWGRTYWGGAMFCLVADIEIRRATANREGLQDALRAIVAERATIDTEWPLQRVLSVGDKATGTNVLTNLYNSWKETPVSVNLDKLWLQLGVEVNSRGIVFESDARLADLRSSITERPNR